MPEAQTIRECAALQRACEERQSKARAEMYEHMNEQHAEVLDGLTEIKTTLAYQKGQANGRDSGPQAPIAGIKWPSVSTLVKCGLLIGALVAGGVVGGCEGAKLAAARATAAATTVQP